MNTPHERLTRSTFSLPLGEVHALVGGAVNARPLVRPRAHSNSWVKVPTGGDADPS
ncbi:MAG TPA: hypothetical protein VIS71_02105 [Terrimicrobium sp.]